MPFSLAPNEQFCLEILKFCEEKIVGKSCSTGNPVVSRNFLVTNDFTANFVYWVSVERTKTWKTLTN